MTNNYLDAYFCNLCLEPLEDDFNGICPSCGQKTTPIPLAERLNADKNLDMRTKNTPRSMTVLVTIACVIHLIYCITAFIVLFRAVYLPTEEQTTIEEISYDFTPTEEELRIARLYEKALKYDDVQEFVKDMSPSGQEQVKYYYSIWNYAWLSKSIADRAESAAVIYQNNSYDSAGKFLGFVGGTAGILVATLEGGITVIHLAKCIAYFLGKKGLGALMEFSINHCQTIIVTLNVPCFVMFMYAWSEMSRLNKALGGDALRAGRRARIFRAKQRGGLADDKHWCCEGCGYINPTRVSECISCGKYKRLPRLKEYK